MTLENPSYAEPGASQDAIALNGFICVARARWLEPALREDEMRQCELVAADECHYGEPWQSLQRHVSVSIAPVNSARRSANEAAYADRLARTTRSMDGR
jgi:hypothetical protein